ncbi:MAG TPA: hypothetical protein VHG91_19790 [Longimicrobium sp.]|nr:hypothetical protein [Longimicrobium sp.]
MRGAIFSLAAFAACVLLLFILAREWWTGDLAMVELAGGAALLAALGWTAWGVVSYWPSAFVLAAVFSAALFGLSVRAYALDPRRWWWPLVGAASAMAMGDYLFTRRKHVLTARGRQFADVFQPFESADFLDGPQDALIELNNLIVVAGGIGGVDPEATARIEERHGVSLPDDLPRESQIVFARYLRHFLRDDELSEEEQKEVAALEGLLRLAPESSAYARRVVGRWMYRRRAEAFVADRRLDADEQAKLDRLQAALELGADEARATRRELAENVVGAVRAKATADARLSPEEEAELTRAAAGLGIDLAADARTRAELERFRLLWEVENGRLPEVDAAPLLVRRGERCHAVRAATLAEVRAVQTEKLHFDGVVYDAAWLQREWKGKDLRTRGTVRREVSTRDEPRYVDGTLVCTSERLVFLGKSESVTIEYRDLLGFKPGGGGIEVRRAGAGNAFFGFSDDVELFAMILGQAVRRATGRG